MKRAFELDGTTQEDRSMQCFQYFSGIASDLTAFPYNVRKHRKGNYLRSDLEWINHYKQRFVEEVGDFISEIKSQTPPIDSKTQRILEGCYKTWVNADWKTEKIEIINSQLVSIANYIAKTFSGMLPADPTKRRMMIMEEAYQELLLERLKPHAPEYMQ